LRSYCTRTVSPSAHPRPASVAAADFFPASALFHQQALRPLGAEDARCVRSISATQSNYVYPRLVCSRLALATFAAGTPHGVLGSVRQDRGTGRFTTSGTASADRWRCGTSCRAPCGLHHERGRFLPTAPTFDRASDIPVALSRSPSRLPRLREGCMSPCRRLLASVHGSEDAIERRDHP